MGHLRKFRSRLSAAQGSEKTLADIAEFLESEEADALFDDSSQMDASKQGDDQSADPIEPPKSEEPRRATIAEEEVDPEDQVADSAKGKAKVKKKKIMKKKASPDAESLEMTQPLLAEEVAGPMDLNVIEPDAMGARKELGADSALKREGYTKKQSTLRFATEQGQNVNAKPSYHDRPENPVARASGKAKIKAGLQNAQKELSRMGADVALEKCGMSREVYEITPFVYDLRSSKAQKMPRKFLKTRLEKVDFSEEIRRSEQRKHLDVILAKEWHVPDTPDVKVHMLLDQPESSRVAKIWAAFMSTVIGLSVLAMFVKSLMYKDTIIADTEEMYWRVAEAIFTIVFLAELLVRFAVADALGNQTHVEFLLKPLNICDFMSCLPFVVDLLAGRGTGGQENLRFLRVARLLRLSRVLRLARLGGRDGSSIFGPVAVIMTIIWGVYLKETGY